MQLFEDKLIFPKEKYKNIIYESTYLLTENKISLLSLGPICVCKNNAC